MGYFRHQFSVLSGIVTEEIDVSGETMRQPRAGQCRAAPEVTLDVALTRPDEGERLRGQNTRIEVVVHGATT
jgi:hypothetical protein